jgi:plasmid stabilization system protein ParE
LDRTFGVLADFPGIFSPDGENRAGYRRFRSHFIFYTDEVYRVATRDVGHAAKDIGPQFFD